VFESTNAIRDALTTKLDPVYGLTTMHASLRVFYADAPPSPEGEEVKAATFAFGLMALGKYLLRLPAEIAEEELPRLKNILISVCILLLYILLSLISCVFSVPVTGVKRQIFLDRSGVRSGMHHRSSTCPTR
jgi:hypothetical protein